MLSSIKFETNQIPISARSLGGSQGRKIIFDTFTGEVRMKYIIKQKDL